MLKFDHKIGFLKKTPIFWQKSQKIMIITSTPADQQKWMDLCKKMSSKRASMYVDSTKQKPGANPTIVSYNASVVKFYSAIYSLPRF
jgi:hypothetical protein